jgi:hypothetical protein
MASVERGKRSQRAKNIVEEEEKSGASQQVGLVLDEWT